MEKMNVYTSVVYKGRRLKTNELITDYEKSGTYCLGFFSNMDGIGIVVVKIFKYEQTCHIYESSWTEDYTKANEYKELALLYENKYKIEHFFGNVIASSVLPKNTRRNPKGYPIRGWLTVDIQGEHLIFLVLSRQKGFKFANDELLKLWTSELKNIAPSQVRQKNKAYPLTFALACVLEGAIPDTNTSFETISNDLYDENDDRVLVPISYNPNEHEKYLKYIQEGYLPHGKDFDIFQQEHKKRYCS